MTAHWAYLGPIFNYLKIIREKKVKNYYSFSLLICPCKNGNLLVCVCKDRMFGLKNFIEMLYFFLSWFVHLKNEN